MPKKKKNPFIDAVVRFMSSEKALSLDSSSKEELARVANMTEAHAINWLVENPKHPITPLVQEIVNDIPKGRGPTMSRMKQNAEYITPGDFIKAVERRFGPLQFDLAASSKSTRAPLFYSVEDDSLDEKNTWDRAHEAVSLGRPAWLNPPFGKELKSPGIKPWMAKVYEHTRKPNFEALTLTPVSTGQWFYRHVFNKADIILLDGRLTYEGEKDPYPKDCMLCRYRADALCGVWLWDWRTDEMVPLGAQRPEAWACQRCARPRVNLEGLLGANYPGKLCYTCVSAESSEKKATARKAEEPKVAVAGAKTQAAPAAKGSKRAAAASPQLGLLDGGKGK